MTDQNSSFDEFENKPAENQSQDSSETEKVEEPVIPTDEKTDAPVPRGRTGDKVSPVKGRADDGVRNVTQLMTEDAKIMKDVLAKQEKISFYIPLLPGEKQGSAYESVTINGYRLEIKKGMMVNVPKQVAEMLIEHLNIQNVAGLDQRLDNKAEDVKNALS